MTLVCFVIVWDLGLSVIFLCPKPQLPGRSHCFSRKGAAAIVVLFFKWKELPVSVAESIPSRAVYNAYGTV
jgi:hypothetical protein